MTLPVVGTGDDRLGGAPFWPAADATFTSVLAGYSARITPAAPYPAFGGSSGIAAFEPHLHSDAPKSSRRRRCRKACRWLWFPNRQGPPVVFFSRRSTLRRAFRSLYRLKPSPRAHLEPQRLPRRYPSRLTATERRLWALRLKGSRSFRSLPVPLRLIWILQLGDPPARYSYTDWEREQRAEPMRDYAVIQYILLGRPSALATEASARFPSHQLPSFSGIQELAGKVRPHAAIIEDNILLVRNPTPAPTPYDRRDARLAFWGTGQFVFTCRCSCSLGSRKCAILLLPAISAPRHVHFACSNVSIGG